MRVATLRARLRVASSQVVVPTSMAYQYGPSDVWGWPRLLGLVRAMPRPVLTQAMLLPGTEGVLRPADTATTVSTSTGTLHNVLRDA
eukprot:1847679-Rhodomonas_salina.6